MIHLGDLLDGPDTVLPQILACLHPIKTHLKALRMVFRCLVALFDDRDCLQGLWNAIASVWQLGPVRPTACVSCLEKLSMAMLVLHMDPSEDLDAYGAAAGLVLEHAAAQLPRAISKDLCIFKALRRYTWAHGANAFENVGCAGLKKLAVSALRHPESVLDACKLLFYTGVDSSTTQVLLRTVLGSSNEAAVLEWGFAAIYASEWSAQGLEQQLREAMYRAVSRTCARDIHSPGMGLHASVCSHWTIATSPSAVHAVVDFLDAMGPPCRFPFILILDECACIANLLAICPTATQFLMIVIESAAHVPEVVSQITQLRQQGRDAVSCCPVLRSALHRDQVKTTHFKLNRIAGCSLQFVLSDLARLLDAKVGMCSVPF